MLFDATIRPSFKNQPNSFANGVFLDVGLFWISARVGHCPVLSRNELVRPSGYSYLKLIGHFWRLILTTGTRPLRLITLMGIASMVLAVLVAGRMRPVGQAAA